MARKKASHSPPTNISPFSIGNCEVLIEGATKGFNCESDTNSLIISASKGVKIRISVVENAKGSENCGLDGLDRLNFGENGKEEGSGSYVDCLFSLINPKDADSSTMSLVQDILSLYMKELPAMNYAANTGKKSSFLERCVSNGKFCTLLLKSVEGPGKVIAAVTYQIIPADTQFAEIPLAAVCSAYQHKGIGRLLYMELRKRFLDVGISTVLCWGDKESEGFWHKQGFVSIAEVNTKGRAQKLPIRADIRRALCYPGHSTLMVSHLNKNPHDTGKDSIKLHLKSCEKSISPSDDAFYSLDGSEKGCDPSPLAVELSASQENFQLELSGFPKRNSTRHHQELAFHEKLDNKDDASGSDKTSKEVSLTYERNLKRGFWEGSLSSLKSKRVKATHLDEYHSYPESALVLDKKQMNASSISSPLGSQRKVSEVKGKPVDAVVAFIPQDIEECTRADTAFEHGIRGDSQTRGMDFNIMLMDIANDAKKASLTKIILDLGGSVTTDGSVCTHVLTGKARRTWNFCTALCSGAWIVSPLWLKESFRRGKFVDEEPFILDDKDYQMKFRVDLKDAVLRSRRNPRGLLKGYSLWLATHVEPCTELLSGIVQSAGGDVNIGMGDIRDKPRTTIFIACEEDMDEALLAVRSGIPTFSSDWLMCCIMKQELDLAAPQFAESL